MKNALKLIAVFVVSLLGLSVSATAQTGCPGQDPYNCASCTNESTYRFRVCIGPVTDTIDVTMCTQFATTQYVSNPCTNCARPLDAITWVRKVCVPSSLALVSIDSIYQAILKATSLCCTNQFIPATIRNCDSGTGSCNSADSIYCHVTAFPNCVKREGNCWLPCDNNCNKLCYVERRYCRQIVNGELQCMECTRAICSNNNQCAQPCIEVNCSIFNFPLGCCSSQ